MLVVYIMLIILFPDGEMLVFFQSLLVYQFSILTSQNLAGVETADVPP